jgi:hypothetical protein
MQQRLHNSQMLDTKITLYPTTPEPFITPMPFSNAIFAATAYSYIVIALVDRVIDNLGSI